LERTREKERKFSRGSEKNQALVCWKEEGKALSLLQKEIRVHVIGEVEKKGRK